MANLYNEALNLTDHNPPKSSVQFCAECTPAYVNFSSQLVGYCESCGKRALLTMVKNYEDEIDREFYHETGGEG